MKRKKGKKPSVRGILYCVIFMGFILFNSLGIKNGLFPENNIDSTYLDTRDLPEYTGSPYVTINDNEPEFDAEDYGTQPFESYSSLDDLGRCGTVYANIGIELMPTEERESISQVHPTGWQSVTYDGIDGEYLYNRCHLIGFQLTGENANDRNLITGTRYMNVEGMLPFENQVADYIRSTGNHVLYRATPFFEGNDLVAKGVQIEAGSVEDQGRGISFNVYVFNVQPGIEIDYATGKSRQYSNNEGASGSVENNSLEAFFERRWALALP